MNGAAETVPVSLGERSYNIIVGGGQINSAGAHIADLTGARTGRVAPSARRAVIVTDSNVAGHWLRPLQKSLDAAGLENRAAVIEPGEAAKDFAGLERLVRDLLAHGLERSDILVALGGGVVGDLAGFAAAVALRGVDFVQIPTTLLAQVDSSAGGKTGINTPEGKNLVGAFYQPRLVLADTDTLATLPKRELAAGYAEVVKYGIIGDEPFFTWLEQNGARVLALEEDAVRHAVVTSCKAKAAVTAADERETGQRALLNLGHTFAHAFEAEAGYDGRLNHGEAVAAGMVMALRVSERMDLCAAGAADRLGAHLKSAGLPAGLSGAARADWTAEGLIQRMGSDKKNTGGRITFILARAVGEAFVSPETDMNAVRAVLEDALAEARA